MKPFKERITGNLTAIFWVSTALLALALLFARAIFPELIWLTVVVSALLVASSAALITQNRKALKGRAAAFGLNTVITAILVIGIIGVLNFLVLRYPAKLDLTKNQIHTLSDQTSKLIRELKNPVKAVYFSKTSQRESARPLLENLKALNTKFEVEYVDPDKEPARAKQVDIKKYGTLQLIVGTKEAKVEDVNEEKLTNSLIKLLKEKIQSICAITGHGEKGFSSNEAEGYQSAKKALEDQSYQVKDLSLLQEGKIPETCDAIAIVGPTKAFFAQEIKTINEYLANGGRALIAVDLNIKGAEYSPEIFEILKNWHIKPVAALIVDPLSKLLGVDAAVPIIATFSKDNKITKDFQNNCYFPFARPLEILPGAPAGMNVSWFAQTTPKSWGEVDFAQLASGQVKLDAGTDKAGPLTTGISVEGKQRDSKAAKNSRLVVYGTSQFATNNYSRFGGNMDLFINSVSWLMEDENLISIRSKAEDPGKVELSQKQGTFIFLLTVIVIPLLVAAAGIIIWVLRKRL